MMARGVIRPITFLLVQVLVITYASINREITTEIDADGECDCVTQEICGAHPNAWTRTPTGCECYFDSSRTDCACCMEGGCQCGISHPDQCVQCGQAEDCGAYSDIWTRGATGCQCYFDSSRTDCACCEEGGCQCPEYTRHQCVRCGLAENCGTYGDIWTHKVTGCPCYFDSSRDDCACCEEGGCQCPDEHKQQCVQCGHGQNCGKHQDGWSRTKTFCQCYHQREAFVNVWTRTGTGCNCYFDNSATDCACCRDGGCQCPTFNRHQCVRCGDGAACRP